MATQHFETAIARAWRIAQNSAFKFVEARQMLQRGFCLLVLLGTVAAFAGTVRALDQLTLDSNRTRWDSQDISNYDLVQGILCFCPPDFGAPALVTVRQDAIVSVIDAHTHQSVSPADFLTIDWMFDRLQFALEAGEFWIDAEFDDRLGYPRYFRIDGAIGDDDYAYRVFSLTVVPEPASICLVAIALAVGWIRRPRRSVV
jgi:hypothetical protein